MVVFNGVLWCAAQFLRWYRDCQTLGCRFTSYLHIELRASSKPHGLAILIALDLTLQKKPGQGSPLVVAGPVHHRNCTQQHLSRSYLPMVGCCYVVALKWCGVIGSTVAWRMGIYRIIW